MKTILTVLTLLLFAASSDCFALMTLMPVSKQKAADMGIAIRVTGNGPDEAWVEMEFKAEGALKEFSPEKRGSRVSLEIRDGEKFLLGYAALQQERSNAGSVIVRFLVNRVFLDKVSLRIVVGSGLIPGGAYEMAVKDFVEVEKLK
jgi:hypothetical protein